MLWPTELLRREPRSLGAGQASATETAASKDPCPFDEYGIGGGSSSLRSLISASRPPSTSPNSACRQAAWAKARRVPPHPASSLRAGGTRARPPPRGPTAASFAHPASSPP